MKTIKYPAPATWSELLKRPQLDTTILERSVANILAAVRQNGDNALRDYALRFDKVELDQFLVSGDEYDEAEALVPYALKKAIELAIHNIEKFHQPEPQTKRIVETVEGVNCWKRSVPIEKVGLYVPAGTAPLFSTVLMLVIPARLAGCDEIVVCSPPDQAGRLNPATLYAARHCGATAVYKIGGAQAIAAMAFGTETVKPVYKIFGPGNQFVTEAKLQILRDGVAIDMPAGPSELAILADSTAIPSFAAADLLSQAEHGSDSQVVLVSTSELVIREILSEVDKLVEALPRKEIALAALDNSRAILVKTTEEAVDLLNAYAPEHLILAIHNADDIAEMVVNAGSVFIGNYSCESAGDYASGTNHTLPTNGAARAYSGVSVESYMKTITFQKLSDRGIENLGPTIETMAAAEGLAAHERAVSIRLAQLRRRHDV